ncbi:hypothetical protein [uncultured Bacteroides sp.]|uniref:hypothetical protein n=1 Tax=uncultured Bacteroides sp. TaxID=162156 RepID=UPI002AA7CB23|nr:hypothetical protein [uncultured Bacteroides sp.]
MELIDNKNADIRLDGDHGILYLKNMLFGTMIFLYNGKGEIQAEWQYSSLEISHQLSQSGMYVIVITYASDIVVKRVFYEDI